MRANLRSRLAVGLAFGLLVVAALFILADVRQVADRLAGFRWQLAPLILLCTLFNYVLRFIKWHYYLGLIGVSQLSPWESARIFVAGFPLAVTPGKVGEALKAAWLNQASGAPIAKGIPVVLAERISDGLAVLALSTLGVIAYPRYWPAFAFVLSALLGIVLLSQIRPLALALLRLITGMPALQRFGQALHDFYEGTYTLFRARATLSAVALGTLAWLGEGFGMYLVLLGLGVPAGITSFSIAVFVLAFSTAVGAVSALPGGLLAAEGSIAGMLSLLLQLPTSMAAAATLLIRLGTLWFGVALGLLCWAISPGMVSLSRAGRSNNSQIQHQS